MPKIFKNNLELQYINYRSLLSTLRKNSKQTFSSYFKENTKDIKKTWKGIKSIYYIYEK